MKTVSTQEKNQLETVSFGMKGLGEIQTTLNGYDSRLTFLMRQAETIVQKCNEHHMNTIEAKHETQKIRDQLIALLNKVKEIEFEWHLNGISNESPMRQVVYHTQSLKERISHTPKILKGCPVDLDGLDDDIPVNTEYDETTYLTIAPSIQEWKRHILSRIQQIFTRAR